MGLGQAQEALDAFETAQESVRGAKPTPAILLLHNNTALTLLAVGRAEEAVRFAEEACRCADLLLGDHEDSIGAYDTW